MDARGGVEFAAVDEDAILDYYAAAADVAEVHGWVAFDEDQIGESAGSDDSEILFLEELGGVVLGDLEGFGSGYAGLDFEFKLAMEIRICGVVGAGEDGNTGIVEALGHGEHGRVGVFRALAIAGGCGVAADRPAAVVCAALDLCRVTVEDGRHLGRDLFGATGEHAFDGGVVALK